MFHAIVTKGYDIDPYAETHINVPQHSKRFSLSYILNSNMPSGRKIMFLSRLAIHALFIFGLLLGLLMKFRK